MMQPYFFVFMKKMCAPNLHNPKKNTIFVN